MTIVGTSRQSLLDSMVGPMQGISAIGAPEGPTVWSHSDGGFINTEPDNLGGLQSGANQHSVRPWVALVTQLAGQHPVNLAFQIRRARLSWLYAGTWQQVALHDVLFRTDGSASEVRGLGAVSPTVRAMTPVPVAGAGGGSVFQVTPGWAPQAFWPSLVPIDQGQVTSAALTFQSRCVPLDLTAAFDPLAADVGAYGGFDWHGDDGGRLGECCHGALIRVGARWRVHAAGIVEREGYPGQAGKGLAEAQWLAGVQALDPENEIWLERGPYDAQAGLQTLVLRRSETAQQVLVYSVVGTAGVAAGFDTQLSMPAGVGSIQFDLPVPGAELGEYGMVYARGAGDASDEDFAMPFRIGSGGASGDVGADGTGGGSTVVSSAWFAGGDTWAPLSGVENSVVDEIDIEQVADPNLSTDQVRIRITTRYQDGAVPNVAFDSVPGYSHRTLDVAPIGLVSLLSSPPVQTDASGQVDLVFSVLGFGAVQLVVTVGVLSQAFELVLVDPQSAVSGESVWAQLRRGI